MELRHLRYFIVLAEELNFTRAAERLRIAQPPLSQQIRSLEDELGLQLFDRRQRPLQLTPAGRVFLEQARQIFTQVEQAIGSAQRASRGENGRIVVGINTSIANSVLPAILRTFRDRFPNVELVLHELVSYQQLQELRDRQIDVGFVNLHHLQKIDENDDTLSFISILQEPFVIVLPESHPLAGQPQVSLAALADEVFILPPPHLPSGLYCQIVSLCQRVGFSPNVRQEATWMSTVLSLVAGGVGISLLPANAKNLQRIGVVFRFIQEQSPIFQTAMVWRRSDASVILHNFLEVVRHVTQP
ncbi:MAG TPA: LysR family transcriptional regulator [Chroococcales cyanobacterium]|jgi:DNA-binding transcriptional LysR family regulator